MMLSYHYAIEFAEEQKEIFAGDMKAFLDVAIECIAKQIPKKPSKTFDHTWGIEKVANVCPCCDYYLGNHTFITVGVGKEKIIYCETCGQALDWSDDDE